jgi:hypothetical protein
MSAFPTARQRGQSTTELLVAMAFIVPLFMSVVYIGKYSDIKHQTIQASRYAAFERALDPHSQQSDAVIQNETVARFFSDGAQHTIGFEDKPAAQTGGDENPVWMQLNGDPMIGQYADVSVAASSPSVDTSLSQALLTPMDLLAGGPTRVFDKLGSGVFGAEADVSVKVANIAHFAPLSNLNLSIGATTVIATDPWNAGGAQNVADHFPSTPLPGMAVPQRLAGWLLNLPGVGAVLNTLAYWFVDTGLPEFGCVKPDVVPDTVAPGASYDPMKSSGVNQCD